ncbi:hypothetical protein [Halorubrum sodomense]|uniref:hypothetical protein n=1 Tax=Halorubrum sodomense TaxID=35743 RepID=UPI001FE7253F|nr:hypothetical protein [Halorubrum sodomense]
MWFRLKYGVPESQPLALVGVRDRDALEGVAEPVDDLGRLVPDDYDQLVGSGIDTEGSGSRSADRRRTFSDD